MEFWCLSTSGCIHHMIKLSSMNLNSSFPFNNCFLEEEEGGVGGYITRCHDNVTHVTNIADYNKDEFLCISLMLKYQTPWNR